MHPIWKDYYVDFGSVDSVYFGIMADQTSIYTGRAYKRPGESTLRVRINDICADYLKNPRLQASEGFVNNPIPTFVVVDTAKGVEVASVQFLNDWSYEDRDDVDILSNSINGKVTNRMFLPQSTATNQYQEVELKITNADNTNTELKVYYGIGDVGVYLIDLSITSPGDGLDVWVSGTSRSTKYQVVDSCAKYALYYVNARGGWDAFIIEGNHTESDSLTRHVREQDYDNQNPINRGRVNYVTEAKKNMILHTGWLSDEESSRMHNLLNSTDVYLFDMDKRSFIPVLLVNTITDYKTYKSNGGRLVNYAIEVEFANDRIRR